jgi:glutathione peroxidase
MIGYVCEQLIRFGKVLPGVFSFTIAGAAYSAESNTAHEYWFTSIDETARIELADFEGKTVLVVNTASFCGFTPQYQGLQSLWTRYKEDGLVVLGVPSNDFGNQEPHSEEKIRNFCQGAFNVSFPMTKKYSVRGAQAHPFYQWVATRSSGEATPRWNFHKILIGKHGQLAGWFSSSVKPNDKELTTAIERELKAGPNAKGS